MDNFTPVSALAGGALIGLASVWLLAANGRIAGVSGILHGRAMALRHGEAAQGARLPGWGIGGYCPGPALTALSNLSAEVLIFVTAMIAGGLFAKIVFPAGSGA